MAVDAGRTPSALLAPALGLGARRRGRALPRRRAWLVARALQLADVTALAAAYLAAEVAFGRADASPSGLLFAASLPGWVALAGLHGLYRADVERTDHSTADELLKVFQFITVGSWLFFLAAWADGPAVSLGRAAAFWAGAVVALPLARLAARGVARRQRSYLQRALIIGAGPVGQLLARKLTHHDEYGVHLVGLVDDEPRELRADLDDVAVFTRPEYLREVVETFEVERVYVSAEAENVAELVETLNGTGVRVDVVPHVHDLVVPDAAIDTVEGMPVIPVTGRQPAPWEAAAKRAVDILGAGILLLLSSPVFVLAALLIRRDSPGPVFFRQTRLGEDMREFEVLKFRTMVVDVDDSKHREFIRATMDRDAVAGENGLFKLDRSSEITRVGRILRRTSLDELPQLLNVLRGEMSLVGPRPCIPYETENFLPHHFERFSVPQGITGYWQATARAHSTFFEALEMDVAYARAHSFWLDLRLLFRTARQFVNRGGTR